MSNSFVFLGACSTGLTDAFVNAFKKNGATAVVVFDDVTSIPFLQERGVNLVKDWLASDSLRYALSARSNVDPYLKEAAKMQVSWRDGVSDLSLKTPVIQDGSFEDWNMMAAWTREGDVRKLANKFPGNYYPTDGTHCAIITTGFGSGDSQYASMGKMSQVICLNAESTLSFDWNFFSEEFMEYVGTAYQDYFAVTMEEVGNPSNTIVLTKMAIDNLAYPAGNVTLVPGLHFDILDGTVYATGWRHATLPVPENMKGRKVVIRFEVSDIGDSSYDSAVLLDKMEIKGYELA